MFPFTAFLAIFKRFRQAQAPAGTCLSRLSRHTLRHQPAWTGPDRQNRLMPAHTGYYRHNTGPNTGD
jgi:hypothetical protein